MTWAAETLDLTYTILDSSSTPTTTSRAASAVTASDTDCLLTATILEVRDMTTGEWEDYSTMASPPAWITNFSAATPSFDIVTTDSSLAPGVFALRFSTTDDAVPPGSAHDTFTVTFEYECHTDVLTL